MHTKGQNWICAKLVFFNNFQHFVLRKYDCNWRYCKEDSSDFDSRTVSWDVSGQMLHNHGRDWAILELDPSHNENLKAPLPQYALKYKTTE